MNMISPMIEETGASTGGATSGGSGRLRELQLLRNDLARLIDIGAPFELDPDHGDADAGRGAYAAYAGRPVQRRLDGKRDLRLDFLRGHAVRFGNDRNGGRGEIGEHVHRHLHRLVRAPHQQQRRGREHKQTIVEGPLNDLVYQIRNQKAESRNALGLSASFFFFDEGDQNRRQLICFLCKCGETIGVDDLSGSEQLEPVKRFLELHQTAIQFRNVFRFRARTDCFAIMSAD